MSHYDAQPPRFRTIVLGLSVGILILGSMFILGDNVKWLGWPLLYLPAQLGVVQQVTSAEAHVLPKTLGFTPLAIQHPGRYTVFANDFKMLQKTDADLVNQHRPWFEVRPAQDQPSLPVSYVQRGLSFYDSPFAAGRPIFTFSITTPSTYAILAPRSASITVIPDYTTDRETTIYQSSCN